MKSNTSLLSVLFLVLLPLALCDDPEEEVIRREVRQANAEDMVENILQWLQGVYAKRNRKARQGNLAYLPPAGQNAERPRPFQPPSSTQRPYKPPSSSFEPSSSTPFQPSGSSSFTSPSGSPFSTSNAPYPPSSQSYPDYSQTGYPATGASPNPPFVSPQYVPAPSASSPNYSPSGSSSTSRPYSPAQTPSFQPSYPSAPETSYKPNTPEQPFQPIPTRPPAPYPSSQNPPRPSFQPSSPAASSPSYRPSSPAASSPGYQPSSPAASSPSYRPSSPAASSPSYQPSSPAASSPSYRPSSPGYQPSSVGSQGPTSTPSYRPNPTTQRPFPDDDDNHPPHIHAIDVQCAKDMMTINLEFNKVYNGIIYSKGFYKDPKCRYVQENSNQIKYSFTLSLNSCGTDFINGFETQGKSYLENVLVFQNEVGIQEVWDSIRSVRCLWEGNLNKQLSISLSVGMLNQEVVTFSGDTAMASLDIQLGRGPFASPANGLVKIGETMTLVVSITGDPGFDIQVKDCKARDSTSTNVVALTDEDGCVLKPKVFGAFQKTRDTGNTGSSIIAYAYFNAFKFPDVMDLILECNVELCKVNCEMCPNPNQKLEPGKRRRRRDTNFVSNETLVDPVTVGKALRVVLPEDLAFPEPLGLCLSYSGFVWGAAFVLSVMVISSLSAGCMWLKLQRHANCKNHF